MREIEFRAWDKIAGIMVCPVVAYSDHVGFSDSIKEKFYTENDDHLECGDDWYWLFDYELMQYTGLRDANGDKIFEGDLMQDSIGLVGEVSFKNGAFGVVLSGNSFWDFNNSIDPFNRVIGNIYLNPKLLNPV